MRTNRKNTEITKTQKMESLTYSISDRELDSVGNWEGPKALFPTITVDQNTTQVAIELFSVSNRKRGQWGCTHEHEVRISDDGQVLRLTGLVGLRNDRRSAGGRQQFCYFVFQGDSGHYYTHRAPATKGWLECPPEKLLARLRKMGCGAAKNVIQQGDFLLKPANGKALPLDQFLHEWAGAGHHKFSEPVLSEYAPRVGRIVLVPAGKSVELHHEAVDGIQHPMQVVPAGQWIVGTTAAGLRHNNMRD